MRKGVGRRKRVGKGEKGGREREAGREGRGTVGPSGGGSKWGRKVWNSGS